jgi:hypothetical protein
MEKFVNSLFARFDSSKVPALKWGIENESKAFQKYQKSLKNNN